MEIPRQVLELRRSRCCADSQLAQETYVFEEQGGEKQEKEQKKSTARKLKEEVEKKTMKTQQEE